MSALSFLFKRKDALFALLLGLAALPVSLYLVFQSQEIREKASHPDPTGILSDVTISINCDNPEQVCYTSAIALDTSHYPIHEQNKVTYEWGVSADGAGDLIHLEGPVSGFNLGQVGTGDIWVLARQGGNTARKSFRVENGIPVAFSFGPTPSTPHPSPQPEVQVQLPTPQGATQVQPAPLPPVTAPTVTQPPPPAIVYNPPPEPLPTIEIIPPRQSQPTPTPNPFRTGDLDKDSDIDIFDYNIFIAYFRLGRLAGGTLADLDGDGDVDLVDYNIFIAAFKEDRNK